MFENVGRLSLWLFEWYGLCVCYVWVALFAFVF